MVIKKTKKNKKDTPLLIFNNFHKKGKIEKKGKKLLQKKEIFLIQKETFSNLVILKSNKKSNEKSRNLNFEIIKKLLSLKNPKIK